MSSQLDNSLRHAAATTFEQVVFLLADMPPDEQQRAREVHAVATISFSGPAAGVLQVRACEGLLPRLTANMLGQEIESEAVQLDALGEIANIICGQIFPYLHPISAFEQKPPHVTVCAEPSDERGQSPAAQVQVGLENSRADILLYLFNAA